MCSLYVSCLLIGQEVRMRQLIRIKYKQELLSHTAILLSSFCIFVSLGCLSLSPTVLFIISHSYCFTGPSIQDFLLSPFLYNWCISLIPMPLQHWYFLHQHNSLGKAHFLLLCCSGLKDHWNVQGFCFVFCIFGNSRNVWELRYLWEINFPRKENTFDK